MNSSPFSPEHFSVRIFFWPIAKLWKDKEKKAFNDFNISVGRFQCNVYATFSSLMTPFTNRYLSSWNFPEVTVIYSTPFTNTSQIRFFFSPPHRYNTLLKLSIAQTEMLKSHLHIAFITHSERLLDFNTRRSRFRFCCFAFSFSFWNQRYFAHIFTFHFDSTLYCAMFVISESTANEELLLIHAKSLYKHIDRIMNKGKAHMCTRNIYIYINWDTHRPNFRLSLFVGWCCRFLPVCQSKQMSGTLTHIHSETEQDKKREGEILRQRLTLKIYRRRFLLLPFYICV